MGIPTTGSRYNNERLVNVLFLLFTQLINDRYNLEISVQTGFLSNGYLH